MSATHSKKVWMEACFPMCHFTFPSNYTFYSLEIEHTSFESGIFARSCQQVVVVWFSFSWWVIHFQKETDLDCRQAVKHILSTI